MVSYFLGVDVGNTKTHALIVDSTGAVIAFAQDEPGNHEIIGIEGFRRVLHSVVNAVLADAQLDRARIAGAGFGVAGYDWDSDLPLMNDVIGSLKLDAPYQVVNDALPGLIAGSRRGWGVCVSAGTSVNARGRDESHRREGRVTGNSAAFGEYGGGGEVARKAIEEISRAWSRRGEPTHLTHLFCYNYGSPDPTDLLEGLARGRYAVRAIDALLVFMAAEQGDAVALNILRWSGVELASLAIGVIRQLGFEDKSFEVVLSGSFYKGSPLTIEVMREEIHKVAPGAELVRLDAPPCVGAVMLGMEAANVDYRPLREQIISNTEQTLSRRGKAE